MLPQAFKNTFSEKGVNIHDPKYLTWWEKSSHGRAAKDYNNDWRRFFRDSPDATQPEVLQKGKEIMSRYGIETNY